MSNRPQGCEYNGKDFRRDVALKDLYLYFHLSLPLFLLFLTGAILCLVLIKDTWICILTSVFCFAGAYIFLRRVALGSILMYKAYAPMEVRKRCRFTPSCSTYAMMCFARYGLILGGTLTILRLRRCRPPYGGTDYPTLRSLSRLFEKRKK